MVILIQIMTLHKQGLDLPIKRSTDGNIPFSEMSLFKLKLGIQLILKYFLNLYLTA